VLPAARRPRWLTFGAIRLGGLCLFIVAVGMIKWRLSPHGARLLVLAGVIAALIAGAGFWIAANRLSGRLLLGDRSQKVADAVLLTLRRTGLPILGLAFFLVWTLVYIWLWAFHPHEAFRGLGPSPRFADFFYYAVSAGLDRPPADIIASSRGARSATMIEMMTGIALLAAYLASLATTREESSYGEDRENG